MSLPALHSPPALHNSDLNLHLNLDDVGINVEDILDNTRRQSILGHSGNPGTTSPLEVNLNEEFVAMSPMWRMHTRGSSDPTDEFSQAQHVHRRNQSVPCDKTPRLAEQVSQSNSDTSTINVATPIRTAQTFTRPPLIATSTMSSFRTEGSYHSAKDYFSSGSSLSVLTADETSSERSVYSSRF